MIEIDNIEVTCPVCGKKHKGMYFSKNTIYSQVCNNPECFKEMFWNNKMNAKIDNKTNFIIDGNFYSIGNHTYPLGFAGREFIIRPIDVQDDSQDIVTNDLWFGGAVPEKFKKYFPDTAVFIDK